MPIFMQRQKVWFGMKKAILIENIMNADIEILGALSPTFKIWQ